MSNISDFLDALRTGIPLLSRFAPKTEIPNAYSLSDNPEQFLENGWGVAVGSGSRSAVVDEYCSNSIDRVVTIVITRRVFRLESDPAPFSSAEKDILEDFVELQKWMLANAQLSVDESIQKIEYVGDGGIEFVGGDKAAIAYIAANFLVSISEDR